MTEPGRSPEFPRFVPPARRSTDMFLGVGLAAMALQQWTVAVRVLLGDEPWVGAWYATTAALATFAAVGMIRNLVRYRLQRRREQRAAAVAKPPE